MSGASCGTFNFVVWGVIGSCMSFFGFVGNMLSLIAFQRERRSATTTLLQSLAISDFILLASVLLTDSLPYLCDYTSDCVNPWKGWPYIRYVWILTPVSHMCSIWFVVLIALNRFWAVCRPHNFGTMWRNKKTFIYVASVVVVVISFNLPRFFEYSIVLRDLGNSTYRLQEERTPFGLTTSYRVAYKVMLVNILLVLLPIVVLIVLTILILHKLHANRKKMDARRTSNVRGKGQAGGQGRTNVASEVTFVLVTVVLVAIVCQTPLAVFHFVRYRHRYKCGDTVFYLDNISKLLVNLNSCVNFLIYCFFSPKFRTLLRCQRVGRVEPLGTPSDERTNVVVLNTSSSLPPVQQ